MTGVVVVVVAVVVPVVVVATVVAVVVWVVVTVAVVGTVVVVAGPTVVDEVPTEPLHGVVVLSVEPGWLASGAVTTAVVATQPAPAITAVGQRNCCGWSQCSGDYGRHNQPDPHKPHSCSKPV